MHNARTRKSQAYAILTLCRALYTSTHGDQLAKHRAAAWAQQQFPQWRTLIQDALLWRTAWRDEGVDHAATSPETERFVRFAVQHIASD